MIPYTLLPEYDHEALFSKSAAYMSEATLLRSEGKLKGFQLSASIAMELLCKSTLAMASPALIADAGHVQSIFAACGRPYSQDIRTIQMKTVLERLEHLLPRFSGTARKNADQLVGFRNAEVHSGRAAFAGVNMDEWSARFWEVCSIVLAGQGKSLSDWVGEEEAVAAEDIVQKRRSFIEVSTSSRIAHHRDQFEREHPPRSPSRLAIEAAENSRRLRLGDVTQDDDPEAELAVQCPACGHVASLYGELIREEQAQDIDSYYSGFAQTTFDYQPESFSCPICRLRLEGEVELSVGGLTSEFSLTRETDYIFEPDYGND